MMAKVAPKGTPMKEEEGQQEETSEVEHLTSSALGMQVGLLRCIMGASMLATE